LATRLATSTNIRSTTVLLMRRSRRPSTCSSRAATCGRDVPQASRSPGGQYRHRGAGGGSDGAGAWTGVEHAELTCQVPRAAYRGHCPLVAVPAGNGEPPGKNDEHVGLVDVAFSEQLPAAVEGGRLERGQQRSDGAGVKAAEQLSRAQHAQLVLAARPA